MTETHNVFAGAYVDRAAERRADPRWLAQAARADSARFLLISGNRCFASREDGCLHLLTLRELPIAPTAANLIFLGLDHNAPHFAVTVDAEQFQPAEDWVSLRTLGTLLSGKEANLAAHAVGITHWRDHQKFCPRCGSATQIEAAGYAALCASDGCGNRLFPRVDPAVIVLASRGDQCLLGRQSNWPEDLYSTVAGFVEPGESLEDAVRREVFEETNIQVGGVRYASSQPWPFPASLMLGFHADAQSDDIVTNDGELQDARWFSRSAIQAGEIKLPMKLSIARQLVDTWLAESTACA